MDRKKKEEEFQITENNVQIVLQYLLEKILFLVTNKIHKKKLHLDVQC